MSALVGRGDEPVLGGDALGLAPERRHLDAIDAIAPRVPLHEPRLVLAIGELHAVKLAARESPHRVQPGLDLGTHVAQAAYALRYDRRTRSSSYWLPSSGGA